MAAQTSVLRTLLHAVATIASILIRGLMTSEAETVGAIPVERRALSLLNKVRSISLLHACM